MQQTQTLGVLTLMVVIPLGIASVGPDRTPKEAKLAAGAVSDPGDPSLTIYGGNLALVRRQIERVLPPGSHSVRVEGLPTNMDPTSLLVLNGAVKLLGTHGFRSYQDASSGSGASLNLDLEVSRQVESLELAFLTGGLSWSADYAMVVARDDATARIDGFATIVNGSGAAYEQAEIQLLAGTIQRGAGSRFADDLRMRAMEAGAAAPGLEEASFGDYHLYSVSTPLTLRTGESRRIRLMGAASVATRKEYTFAHSLAYHRQYPEPVTSPVAVSYVLERGAKDGFGDVPLPGGQFRVFQRDEAGRVQLLGIAGIGNTPRAEQLRLNTGYAFDIVGTRTQTDYQRPSGNVYESAWKVELRNQSDSAVTVQVIEQLSGDWRIVESSHRWEKLSAGAVSFRIDVPSGDKTTLEYRISVKG